MRWQLGAPRNASYINLSDYADVEVRPTHTDVISAVPTTDALLLNKAFRDADGRSRIRWLWHQGKDGGTPSGWGRSRKPLWWYQPYTTRCAGQNASLWRGALAGRGGTSFFADHAREATPSSVSRTALCGIWKRQKSDGTVPVS